MDLFKDQNKKSRNYVIGLIVSLLAMLLVPVIPQFIYMIYLSVANPEGYAKLLDVNSVEYFKFVNETGFIFQFIGYIILLIAFPIIFYSIFKRDFLKFKNNILKNIIIAVVSFALMYILTIVVNAIFSACNFPQSSENQGTIEHALNGDVKIFVIVTVVLLAPFVEEVIFRKMIFGTLKHTFKAHAIVQVIVSTLIFSLIHVSTEIDQVLAGQLAPIYLVAIILYLPLSFILSLSYKLSDDNVIVSIIVHMLNNILSVILIFI